MTISTVKELYTYLVKGMLKDLDLEDKKKVDEICSADDEGLK